MALCLDILDRMGSLFVEVIEIRGSGVDVLVGSAEMVESLTKCFLFCVVLLLFQRFPRLPTSCTFRRRKLPMPDPESCCKFP